MLHSFGISSYDELWLANKRELNSSCFTTVGPGYSVDASCAVATAARFALYNANNDICETLSATFGDVVSTLNEDKFPRSTDDILEHFLDVDDSGCIEANVLPPFKNTGAYQD